MNCLDIAELMPLHLAGELESRQAVEFASHLKECEGCADEARQYAALDLRLQAAVLGEAIDSRPVEQRVMWEIRGEAVRARNRWRTGLAAAAALVLAVGGLAGYRTWTHAQPPAAHVAASPVLVAAALDHRYEVTEGQPRRWRVDAASIHELAAREGVAAIDLNGVAPKGYRLEQAKFCRLDGKFYLHLVYTDGRGNYSLYLRHEADATASGRGISASDSDGDHVAGFRAGSVIAMVVTDQSGDAAVRFARAAAGKIS